MTAAGKPMQRVRSGQQKAKHRLFRPGCAAASTRRARWERRKWLRLPLTSHSRKRSGDVRDISSGQRDARTGAQVRPQLPNGRVECKAGHMAGAIRRRNAERSPMPENQIQQIPMRHLDALRLAGRPRRINDVCQILAFDLRIRPAPPPARLPPTSRSRSTSQPAPDRYRRARASFRTKARRSSGHSRSTGTIRAAGLPHREYRNNVVRMNALNTLLRPLPDPLPVKPGAPPSGPRARFEFGIRKPRPSRGQRDRVRCRGRCGGNKMRQTRPPHAPRTGRRQFYVSINRAETTRGSQ